MSRDHGSIYSAVVLVEKHGLQVRPGPGRHRRKHPQGQAEADTLVLPAVLDVEDHSDQAGPDEEFDDAAQLDHLAEEMAHVGAIVIPAWGREPNGDCAQCDVEGALAEVTVYASGRSEEMCRHCVPTFVVSEISTGQHQRPVVVEIPAVSA